MAGTAGPAGVAMVVVVVGKASDGGVVGNECVVLAAVVVV